MPHKCKDAKGALQERTLGTKATETEPANPDKCPNCGTVCKEWTPTEIADQKAAYEAKGGTWGLNPKEPIA